MLDWTLLDRAHRSSIAEREAQGGISFWSPAKTISVMILSGLHLDWNSYDDSTRLLRGCNSLPSPLRHSLLDMDGHDRLPEGCYVLHQLKEHS